MKNMTTLQKIKAMLELEKVKYTLARTTTSSGVVVETEGDFEIGKEVYVVAEDGTTSPAPDGQHTLPEFNIVIETEGGVCSSITPMSSDEEVPLENQEEELSVSPEEQTAIISEVMQILEPRFEEMMRLFAEMTKRFDEMESSMNGEVEDLTSKVEKLSKQPGEKSKTTIDEYNKVQKESFDSKIEKFRRIKRTK